MAREARPSAINHRLMEIYGWSDVQADRAMREVGLEIIAAQRERYVVGTIAKIRRILWGEAESLAGYHWATRKSEELREAWTSEATIAHLLTPGTLDAVATAADARMQAQGWKSSTLMQGAEAKVVMYEKAKRHATLTIADGQGKGVRVGYQLATEQQ